jgi:hypothetical protein
MSGSPVKKGNIIWEQSHIISRVEYGDAESHSPLIAHALRLFSDGKLDYANEAATFEQNPILSMLNIRVQLFTIGEEGKKHQRCAIVNCETFQSAQKAQLRMVADETEIRTMFEVLKTVAKEHNIDEVLEGSQKIQHGAKHAIFNEKSIMFTALRERKLLFSVMWKSWAPRTVKIYSDGTLTYTHPYMKEAPLHHTMRLQNIEVTLMSDAHLQGTDDEYNYGLNVKCQTLAGFDTYFRCIISNKQVLDDLLWSMKTVSTTNNIDRLNHINNVNFKQSETVAPRLTMLLGMPKSSAMRRAVCHSIDSYQKKSHTEEIVNKRGILKWMPVIGSNDLIHGSWWFVIGSFGVLGTAVVMVINRYYTILSDDDSTLSKQQFIATWILMAISGFFSTLGSLAFVRAFHEDPPMTPLFTYYHLQSDELLASWLFVAATFPFVPYCIIYLQSAGYNSLLFLVALGFAIIATIGTLLFVRACYPSDRVSFLFLLFSNILIYFFSFLRHINILFYRLPTISVAAAVNPGEKSIL